MVWGTGEVRLPKHPHSFCQSGSAGRLATHWRAPRAARNVGQGDTCDQPTRAAHAHQPYALPG
jgi:hypothetical protein